jgi:2-amino-4-hydroxy-6-hydroxymethyldihydropteridine diphosphokinase
VSRPRRVRAYVGLGANLRSNLGDPPATLARAVHALEALPGVAVRGVSSLYRTRPVGVKDQPDFHNAVVALDVPAGPNPEAGALSLLADLKSAERALGRTEGLRWGPRVADLDLLVFGRARVRTGRPVPSEPPAPQAAVPVATTAPTAGHAPRPGRTPRPAPPPARLLEVPHPAARDRMFVLAPLADLAPGLVPPGWPETVASARRRREQSEGPEAIAPVGTWNASRGTWDTDAAPARR